LQAQEYEPGVLVQAALGEQVPFEHSSISMWQYSPVQPRQAWQDA
jgi:hypothetical protein